MMKVTATIRSIPPKACSSPISGSRDQAETNSSILRSYTFDPLLRSAKSLDNLPKRDLMCGTIELLLRR